MIVNRKTGQKLVKDGEAIVETSVTTDDGMNKIPVCHMKINRRYQVTWYPADKTSQAIFADYCRYHNNLVCFSISERKLPQLEEYCRNKGVTLRTTEIASI